MQVFLALLACSVLASAAATPAGTVNITVMGKINRVRPEYLSFNFDVHAPTEEYPAWVNASAWNTMNLSDVSLRAWASALAPSFLRIGGSEEDESWYAVGGLPCVNISKNAGNFCVTEERLHELADFALSSGWRISFGLNAMFGRSSSSDRFNASQVEALFRFISQEKDLNEAITVFQYGNELEHKADATPYAADLALVRQLMTKYFGTSKLLVAPDENPDPSYVSDVLAAAPKNTVDAVTWHQYTGYGLDPELQEKVLQVPFYDSITKNGDALVAAVAGRAELWIGETALAWHSGQNATTNAYYSSFWATLQQGQLAWTHTVQCRQTFRGGWYELMSRFYPEAPANPDAWQALIWKSVMGEDVMQVDVHSPGDSSHHSNPDPHSGDVYAFVHCLPGTNASSQGCGGGYGLALINFANDSYSVALKHSDGSAIAMAPRDELHFTPVEGEPFSTRRVAVNGEELIYKAGGAPPTAPAGEHVTDPSQPLLAAPRSILFARVGA